VSAALQSKRSLGGDGRIDLCHRFVVAFESGGAGEKERIKFGEFRVSRSPGSRLLRSAANCRVLKGLGKNPQSLALCLPRW
jgi:hypothetical protein